MYAFLITQKLYQFFFLILVPAENSDEPRECMLSTVILPLFLLYTQLKSYK